MRRSHPTAFVIKKRDSCAVCNNIAPCPACPAGQQCQQIFRSSCQDCPVNKCVPIPGYTAHKSSNSSALGGGLAALFIVAIAAGVGFWFWKRLQAKRRRALHEEAMERREKLRNEKEAMTLQLGAKKSDPNSFAIVDEDELDNDTEYTQVTGVLNNDKDGLGSLAEPTAFRRRSFGAATHLSRITEGAEEEEDDAMSQAGAGANGKRNTIGSVQSNSKSFASGAGPRVSIGSGTSFGSHNIIPIAFKPYIPSTHSGPADDAANQGSLADYQSISPLVLPSTAHRATGAPAIQVNTSRQGPVRPTRAPDLNLRLPDSNRPHQPTTSSPLAATSQPNPASNAYEFMSIDPVETLKSSSSHPYSPSNRPLSGATINTINSTHSGSLSYVLSAPQVITPVSAEGVRRVQLGNGGKAQLVKVPSVKRKPAPSAAADPFRDPTEAEEDGELIPPPSNRFGGDRSSTHSTSTLGIPFGENPFGTIQPPADQTSPSDAEERSSWLTTSKDPFQDPRPSDAVGEEEPRVSIGGLSLLEKFPFDFSREEEKLPGDALSRVEQFK
ncbi:hypothetical protein PHBOTO_003921 [Pseudozyma hubeiensis]|nr:hypothetical protein PHBOTO_003921 [Pseudozyma hubeiensis]